jgi:uncharacterized Zn-binding protein involved in type VI secretion
MSTKAGGVCNAATNVCKTPPYSAPMTFPSIAQAAQANPGTVSKKSSVENQPAFMVNTMITMSSGDEAGSVGGVMSGMIKGPCKYMKGSSKVIIEGQPAAHHTSTVAMNGANANAPMGVQTAPSQTKVLVSP